MSTLHEFDATSMSRDCTCGWVAEARWTVDEARAAWREHINDSRHQPALDRASIPAMFNVVGDELRKLSEGQEGHLSRLADMEENLSRWMDKLNEKALNRYNCHEIELNAIKHRIERGNERLTAIEAQLTALRAEADKGLSDLINRERYTALLNWCEALNNGQDRIETCQEKHRLALESITRILEKVTGTAPKKRQPKRVRKVTKR